MILLVALSTTNGFSALNPIALKRATEAIVQHTPSAAILWVFIYAIMLNIPRIVLSLSYSGLSRFEAKSREAFVSACLEYLSAMAPEHLAARSAVEWTKRFSDGYSSVQTLLLSVFYGSLPIAVDLVVSISIAAVYLPYLCSVAILALAGSYVVVVGRSNTAQVSSLRDAMTADTEVAAAWGDALLGQDVVWNLNGWRFVADSINTRVQRSGLMWRRYYMTRLLTGLYGSVVFLICCLTLLLIGLAEERVSQGGVGGFVLANACFLQVIAPIERSMSVSRSILQSLSALQQILNVEGERRDTDVVTGKANPSEVWSNQISLSFRRVCLTRLLPSFAPFDNISLEVRRGERLILMGPSGAGKSTLLRLACGLISPESGTILFEGQNLFGISPTLLARKIGFIPQADHVFSTSIFDNLTLGSTEISKSEVERMLREIGLEHLLKERDTGLDTLIGAGGIALSGGERKRICIARTLLQRPRLILADEPTNGLDVDSQNAVARLLLHEASATKIIVTHQRHFIDGADTVGIMLAGKLRLFGVNERVGATWDAAMQMLS